MDFVIRLPVSTNWKSKIYDSILVNINQLTKIVYYKSVNTIINTLKLEEVIINIVV